MYYRKIKKVCMLLMLNGPPLPDLLTENTQKDVFPLKIQKFSNDWPGRTVIGKLRMVLRNKIMQNDGRGESLPICVGEN